MSVSPSHCAAGLPPRFRHMAIEGTIGVGKSSLARRLAERMGARLFLERPQDNPYLERFYRAGTASLHDNPYALPTQLFFLFQRLEQMRELAQPGMFDTLLVSDFLFAKDALFARQTLGDEDHLLYTQIYRRYAPQVPQPDLVIWLRADVATLQQRIARRGLAMEQGIASDYLQRLSDGYVRLFSELPRMPVLAIDTDGFNPVDNEGDFDAFVARLAQFRGPRERWSPAALA
jgi:deoxyguanosine kinase